MNSALIKWLYLPDFFRAPNSTNLISECPPAGPLFHTRHLPASWEAKEVLQGDRQFRPSSPASKGRVVKALPTLCFPSRMGAFFHECA